jgi:hypothetical protein
MLPIVVCAAGADGDAEIIKKPARHLTIIFLIKRFSYQIPVNPFIPI